MAATVVVGVGSDRVGIRVGRHLLVPRLGEGDEEAILLDIDFLGLEGHDAGPVDALKRKR